MSDAIFYDLENMIRRAFIVIDRWQLATPEFVEFVRECQALQYDVLRPWERTD